VINAGVMHASSAVITRMAEALANASGVEFESLLQAKLNNARKRYCRYGSPVRVRAAVVRSPMRIDGKRLTDHTVALLLVAAAAALRAAAGANDAATAFLLSSTAIATSAWLGGISPAIVATLAAIVAARLTGQRDLSASVLFGVEGLLLAWLARKASAAVNGAAARLASADARIAELAAIEHGLRRIDAACGRLEQTSAECAVVVVDDRGRVVEWRESATRLCGWDRDAIRGRPAAQMLGVDDQTFGAVLAATRHDGESRFPHACCRADGTTFDGDVAIHRETQLAPPEFTMVIRDKSREQAWRAFADQSAEMQRVLRQEGDVAQRQLATLQDVTDPSLNELPTAQAVPTILERLRAAIDADGIALIRVGRAHRRIVAAPDGLAPDGATERRPADARAHHTNRIRIVHNDPGGVAAASTAGWPDQASSLIAVPVVTGSDVQGTIEVVDLSPRRSTEWEIALVQVVAAQIAGRLQSENLLGADAVA
jgi:PAS domain S-box-containing protein